MYGLAKNLDLSFLEGTTLLQICLSANDVILNFDQDISITIESKIRVCEARGLDANFDDPTSATASLATLLSYSITTVSGDPNGTLRLIFNNGGCLEIYDSWMNFESYQIKHGEKLYVV